MNFKYSVTKGQIIKLTWPLITEVATQTAAPQRSLQIKVNQANLLLSVHLTYVNVIVSNVKWMLYIEW